MNIQIAVETPATRPVPAALRSSVLDHATVKDLASFGLRNNEGLWPSYNCLDMTNEVFFCPNPDPGDKVFASAPWVPAFEFAAQGGAECKAVGLDAADQEAEVKRVFTRSEGKAVERALLTTRFMAQVNGSGETGPEWDAPVDLTPVSGPTGILSLRVALALLEGYAAANYAGVPTIHMPRAAATLLGSMDITWTNGLAYTKAGSKVAIGGGYDTSESDGTWDLYVTGEVYVERSEEVAIQSYKIPGGVDLGSGAPVVEDNMVLMLAERMYRVGVDCLVAKATAKVW